MPSIRSRDKLERAPVPASRIVVPTELDRLLPPALRVFVSQFPFSKWFGLALAVLLLYGPLVGPHVDHNGWRYLIAPLLCAPLAGLLLRVHAPNPYRGYSARAAGLQGLHNRDARASRLVFLFRSEAARSVIWQTTFSVAMIEFAVMTVLLVVCMLTADVKWTPSSYWLWQGIAGCCLGSFIAVASDLFAWALRTWVGSGGL